MSFALLKIGSAMALIGGGAIASSYIPFSNYLSSSNLLSVEELMSKSPVLASNLRTNKCKVIVNSFDSSSQLLICAVKEEKPSLVFFKLEKAGTTSSYKLQKIKQFHRAIGSWQGNTEVSNLQLEIPDRSRQYDTMSIAKSAGINLETLKEMDLSNCSLGSYARKFTCKKKTDNTNLTVNYLDSEYLVK